MPNHAAAPLRCRTSPARGSARSQRLSPFPALRSSAPLLSCRQATLRGVPWNLKTRFSPSLNRAHPGPCLATIPSLPTPPQQLHARLRWVFSSQVPCEADQSNATCTREPPRNASQSGRDNAVGFHRDARSCQGPISAAAGCLAGASGAESAQARWRRELFIHTEAVWLPPIW